MTSITTLYICFLPLLLRVLLSFVIPTSLASAAAATTTTVDNNDIRPSRPPAPLFQGKGINHITLFLSLDPYDAKNEKLFLNDDDDDNNNNNTDDVVVRVGPRYELQMENRTKVENTITTATTSTNGNNDNDKYHVENGLWTNCQTGDIIPTSKKSRLFPMTITVHNIIKSSNKEYRFRVRAINRNGPSPWSSPSEIMETELSTPKAPIELKVESKTSNSIQLSWKQNEDEPMSNTFDLQYRLQMIDEGGLGLGLGAHTNDIIDSDQSALSWRNYPDPLLAISNPSMPEVQEITTLVDEGSVITSGQFWLRLRVAFDDPTQRSNVLESSTISKPIAFNATIESFQDAVEGIRGVRNVRVFRYRPGFWGTSDLPYRGTFSWRVEFDVIGQSSPLFEVHKDDLDGDYAGGYVRCQVRRLLRGQPPVYKERMVANINQLGSEKYYEIRVRGVNSYGKGDWGAVLSDIKTDSDLPDEPPVKPSENQLNSNHVKLVAGSGQRAGNDIDPDYIAGAAMGGFDGENGANGIVVIIQYGREKLNIPSRLFYYYIGRSEQYIVPNDYDQKQIEFIDLKLWGGGGAGGGTNRKYTDHYQDGYSYGGGGGFVQTRLKLDPGDVLTIKVGSGGIYHRLDGEDTYPVNDGFFGGGQGGQSLMGRDGGSGGGYSAVMLNGHTVAMAGGGGGGGATDYCCAHGGPGGGRSGGNGTSPNTPWSLGEDDGAKGIIRNEFTAQDCMSSYCIDDRDKTGLPAFHLHLDRGFAPSASYDIKSKGGIGGKQDLLGTSGSSSDYYVNDYYISPTALVGTSGFGGRGADGKEGGGGGGAGFIGGGGGGSGVDGSGGGGGSGYVDFSFVLVSKRGSGSVPNPPETPTISLISHNSFEINWQSGLDSDYSSIGKRIRAFDIEMSRGRQGAALEGGRCSDEFELVDRVLIQGIEIVMNTTIKELHPLTAYCVRLIAIGDKGTSERSQQIEIITIESPKNKWLDIYPREDIDALNNRPDIEERSRLKNDHNRIMCEIPSRPAPRRGHTLSFTNGKIYLFGGITDHCICLSDTECEKKKTIYSNEVWSFDLRTKIWKSLSSVSWTNNSIPAGREKHSATVLQNGKILIIGGKTDTSPYRGVSNTPLFLGDVWEMDPGQSSSHTVKGLSEMQMITEGGVSYHSTDVSIKRKSRNREGMLCVKEVSVEVMIDHPCVEQIGYITLQRSKMISGLMSRSSTTEAKLFIGTSPSDTVTTCTSAVVNITFYDNAEESILSHGSLIPSEGRFGAAENLRSHFEDTPVDGEWVLSIFDTKIDNIRGSLLDWKLHFDLDYCTEGLRWSKLSTNSNSCEETTITDGKILNNNCNDCGKHIIPKEVFTPRYSHTAVAVGNDVFVIGGYAHGVMSEIWRFNYDTRDWVQLHDNLKRSKSYGQAATLTPFGMIAIGGIRNTLVGTSFIDKVFVYDVLNENETTIDIDFDILSQSFKPENRYQSSLSYIGQDHFLFNEIANVDKKSQVDQAILMFGGDMDLLHSSYLEDMWALTLKKLKTLKDDIVNHQERYEVCRDLLSPDKRVLNPWDWSCGYLANVNSTKICRWEDVVRQAWCLGQYQSFISPL